MSQTSMIVGFFDAVGVSAGTASSFVSLATSGSDTFKVLTNSGQVLGVVTAAIPILRPISMQINTTAGTMTMLQVMVDLQNGRTVNPGDLFTITGNIVGTIAAGAALAGVAAGAVPTLTAIAAASAVLSLIPQDTWNKMGNWLKDAVGQLWPSYPVPNYRGLYLNITLTGMLNGLRKYEELEQSNGFQCWIWKSNEPAPVPAPCPPPPDPDEEGSDGDGEI